MKTLNSHSEVVQVLSNRKMASVTFVTDGGKTDTVNGQLYEQDSNSIGLKSFGAFAGGPRLRQVRTDKIISIKARKQEFSSNLYWKKKFSEVAKRRRQGV